MPADCYPLRLEPFFRNYIWGGRSLASVLGKRVPDDGIWAESWEVVDHPEHESVVVNGPLAGQTLGSLMRSRREWLVGGATAVAGRFPLLLKYLDCARVLSVQVHPDDEYGLRMTPPDLGKTEAWYIMHAEPGAVLYAGLKPGVDRRALADAISAGRTADCLHVIRPQAGDCVFIPAGTVHALGAGLLVAEIQQSSNTTFRLYDWDRVDDKGQSRPLHIEQSLETIDFEAGPKLVQDPRPTAQVGCERLVDCDKFRFDRIAGIKSCELGGDSTFRILTVPTGKIRVTGDGIHEELGRGQSLLIPAACPACRIELTADTTLLVAAPA